jgi:two-component system, OmpR family, phosphate regulon response regulator PhoB
LPTLRSVIFRYGDIAALSAALSVTRGSLPLPESESVGDGEWVLAIFEIGSRRRATAAAARAVCAAGDNHLEFERRDWERLVGFVAARSDPTRRSIRPVKRTSSGRMPIASETAPPASEVPRSRRFEDIAPSSALESSRVPFGARVLVVDDDGSAGDELRAMLAEMGLVVELTSTTKRAEEQLSTLSFDAIVLELHAPGVDTLAFVQKIRADPRVADIPVLFLSSRPTARDAVDAFASGADDFLPKPFRTTELAARIFGLLRRARLARAVGGPGR